jgi:TetR/AcrR family transcriptional repressor of mexJK operon
MDEIASVASVSKQTVYKNFADKQTLFTAIVLGTLDRFGEPFLAAVDRLKDTENLETDLVELARGYLAAIMRPQVLRLRRLIIAEADRLPELARTYYERAPERTIAALADCFAQLATRGLLSVDDPLAAAGQFAFLVLGQPLDRALFCLSDKGFREADHNAHTDAGVRVFLAAYRP